MSLFMSLFILISTIVTLPSLFGILGDIAPQLRTEMRALPRRFYLSRLMPRENIGSCSLRLPVGE